MSSACTDIDLQPFTSSNVFSFTIHGCMQCNWACLRENWLGFGYEVVAGQHSKQTDTYCRKGQLLVKDMLGCKLILYKCRSDHYENGYWSFVPAVWPIKVGLEVLNNPVWNTALADEKPDCFLIKPIKHRNVDKNISVFKMQWKCCFVWPTIQNPIIKNIFNCLKKGEARSRQTDNDPVIKFLVD